MSQPIDEHLKRLEFYITAEYDCSYLPNRQTRSLIASPQHLVDNNAYSALIALGFRRSGRYVYRPHCQQCQACIPVRLIVNDFTASRSQKRAQKRHQQLHTRIMPLQYQDEHFALYDFYQQARHTANTPLEQENIETRREQYQTFLTESGVESVMVEFRDVQNALKMVSVIDIVCDGLSAVYTFYDTTDPAASYGTYGVLWQIAWAKTLQLPYLYLGYWITESQKMAYKALYLSLIHI